MLKRAGRSAMGLGLSNFIGLSVIQSLNVLCVYSPFYRLWASALATYSG